MKKKERIARLEANPEEWFKYYFPTWCKAEPAQFQKEATQRVIAHDEWCEVREWARELATSTRAIMEVTYLLVTGRKKCLVIVSHIWKAARKHADMITMNLQQNKRLMEDYGTHKKTYEIHPGGEGQRFTGCFSIERPDLFLIIDIDTITNCEKEWEVLRRWDWVTGHLLAARTTEPTLTIFAGVAYSRDCCIRKVERYADHLTRVNIADAAGNSTWPERNSNEAIQRLLSKISKQTAQTEYYNNPEL